MNEATILASSIRLLEDTAQYATRKDTKSNIAEMLMDLREVKHFGQVDSERLVTLLECCDARFNIGTDPEAILAKEVLATIKALG